MVGIAPSFLAFVFGIHIVMVNLGIGLAWLVPYLRWKAARSGDGELEAAARSLMRFYAATYGVAGVFGTAFTVFLLSYYPGFIGLAGHITLIPFGIAILMIALHFFSISAYWYGWGRWSLKTHTAIGVLLGVSALLIPLGFRAVFAFLNIPAGLGYDAVKGKLYLDVAAAILKNPTYLPLYLKSVAAAFTATLLMVAGAYAYNYLRTGSKTQLWLAKATAKAAAVGLALMLPLGLWYAFSLRAIPYKFNNVFASLGWKVYDGVAYYDVSWLFILKMVLYAVQIAAVAYALPKLLKGSITGGAGKLLLVAGIAALLAVAAGEYLNAFSQYPFFIAVWPDVLRGAVPAARLAEYGVSIPQQALPAVATEVNRIVLIDSGPKVAKLLASMRIEGMFNLNEVVNSIAVEASVVAVTIGFLAVLLAATAFLLYVLLTPARKVEAVAAAAAEEEY